MSWTDERIDLLKRRWTEGLSASQIASELGGVTRNAVIGKVHRLKLESRIKAPDEVTPPLAGIQMRSIARTTPIRPVMEAAPAPVAPRAPSAPSAAPMMSSVSTPARAPTHSIGATALKMETVPVYETAPVTEERVSAEIVPMSRNLTLIQLSDRTCKWPLGDPLSADFRFCGNHSNDATPYCQYHARLAFQPVSERRRAR